MILQFVTPNGEVQVDTQTVTDAEWQALGLDLALLAKYKHQDTLAAEFNDKTHQGLVAYENWGSLALAQKDTVLYNMLGYILWKEGLL